MLFAESPLEGRPSLRSLARSLARAAGKLQKGGQFAAANSERRELEPLLLLAAANLSLR